MKFFASDAIFGFSWDQVVGAFWQRYPNPHSTHVLTEDVVERRVVGNTLITKRLISKTNRIPKWGERFVSSRDVFVLEESILDLVNKTFTTYTRNIGLQKIMSIDEKCTYIPNPEDPTALTLCQRQAWVNSGIFGFSSVISAFGVQRFRKNAGKAIAGFEFVLNRLYTPDFNANAIFEQKTKKEKIKDSAKKAKEYAKSKAEKAKTKVLQTTSCDSEKG